MFVWYTFFASEKKHPTKWGDRRRLLNPQGINFQWGLYRYIDTQFSYFPLGIVRPRLFFVLGGRIPLWAWHCTREQAPHLNLCNRPQGSNFVPSG